MATFEELAEADATGDIARVYAEIRHYYAAPYVSSLQRHFATFPGVLEWCWSIVRPGFVSGQIPETAWRIAAEAMTEPPLPPISRSALRVLGVDPTAEREIRTICTNFTRVSPLNILFAGTIRHILEGGGPPTGIGRTKLEWLPPEALPPLPAMVAVDALPDDEREVLLQLSTGMGGQVFVPGLYRMLARWPGYLAHAATILGPTFADPGFRERGERIAEAIVAAVPDVIEALPMPPGLPMPDPALHPRLIDAIQTYRRTSPEMIVFGRLLLDALPPEDC